MAASRSGALAASKLTVWRLAASRRARYCGAYIARVSAQHNVGISAAMACIVSNAAFGAQNIDALSAYRAYGGFGINGWHVSLFGINDIAGLYTARSASGGALSADSANGISQRSACIISA